MWDGQFIDWNGRMTLMEEWEKVQKRHKTREIIAIVVMIAFFLVGGFMDWNVLNQIVF